MVDQSGTSQSVGDHDKPFTFGTPPSCRLAHWQVAGLLLMRGRIKDFQQGTPGGPADGDIDWVRPLPSGLVVPLTEPLSGLEKLWGDDV